MAAIITIKTMCNLKKYLPIFILTPLLFLASFHTTFAATSWAQDTVWTIVNGVFGTILGWSGLLLNVGINDFIIGFGKNFINTGVGQTVDMMWSTVRDLFNLTFIFGLVYIGFKMILNSDDSNTKRFLIRLVMAALLVNFSLYITKFVVDVSNIAASEIVLNGFPNVKNADKTDLSGYFMNYLGLQTLWDKESIGAQENDGAAWALIFGTAILFIVASFVFAVGGFMLIIRYAVLCLFMVLSPLMFLGWVFPGMQSYTDAYWKKLLGRAFYAPVYVLLVFFSAKVIDAFYASGIAGGNGVANFGTVIADSSKKMVDGGFNATFPPFILSCIFLVSAVVVGQKMGADGAAGAVSLGRNLTGRVRRGVGVAAGGATFGAAAWASRRSVGYGAQKLVDNENFKGFASRHSIVGKGAYKAAQATAGSSFDARNVGGLGKSVGIGGGQKGGYTKMVKDRVDSDTKFVKDLGVREIYDENGKVKPEYAAEIATKVATVKDRTETERKKLAEDKDIASKKQEALKREADDLKRQVAEAKIPALKNVATEKLRKKEEEIKKADEEYQKINKSVGSRLAELEKEAAQALKQAESESKYAHAINYMNQLDNSQKFWGKFSSKNVANIGGGTLGGSLVLGSGLGAAAGAGIIAATAIPSSQSHLQNASLQNLKKMYGNGGMKMEETESRKKKAKESLDVLKELGDSESKEEKKDDNT